MWEQYRKTAAVTQIFIVSICIAMAWLGKQSLANVVVLFIVMEACAVIGAMWAARLRRKINQQKNSLPLNRR